MTLSNLNIQLPHGYSFLMNRNKNSKVIFKKLINGKEEQKFPKKLASSGKEWQMLKNSHMLNNISKIN